ncbi:unnamed protein product [Trichobilharzia regenti]|uniref:Adenylate cyclase-stimulating G alpha protein n=1 Tax=Trichobilharzia regenti TaxID=157069 RepID=A0A183VSY2_TRIRE|nr:unnamed protein product [Trichobilharzia regenti]VDP99467.1 unnamed protein product [Trichobilharzia regenti]
MEVFSSDKKRRHDYFLKIVQKRSAEAKNIHRIVLIGTGESGKSTFLKQMKLLSSLNQTFSDAYRNLFILEIQRNIVQSLSAILNFMEQEHIKFHQNDEHIRNAKNLILSVKEEIDKVPDNISQFANSPNLLKRNEFYDACSQLWNDKAVKETISKSNEFHLIDCAQYFLDKIDDIRDPAYKPTDDDVLQSRTKTLGIHTETITYNNVNFELIDVGGQREQRAKWIEAMSDGVTAVIFLTDVSAYDMVLAEDHSVNRLRESINLLGQIWRKSPLREKSIILFLNKQDKLEKKVREQRTLFENYFPEYNKGKVIYLIELLRELTACKINKMKKESDIWDKYFAYLLPPAQSSRNNMKDTRRFSIQSNGMKKLSRETIILTEYSQIQSIFAKAFNENLVQNWITDNSPGGGGRNTIQTNTSNNNNNEYVNGQDKQGQKDSQEAHIKHLMSRDDFNAFQRRLHSIIFYQVVSIVEFIKKLFIDQCEQTQTRRIYPFPTTAIDKRNVDRVFESCKDILQGKALTDLIV